MDETLRNFLPKEVRIALRSHKALFYQGGMVLCVSSSVPLTTTALFHLALLILLCLHHETRSPPPRYAQERCQMSLRTFRPNATLPGSPGRCFILPKTRPTVTARYRG